MPTVMLSCGNTTGDSLMNEHMYCRKCGGFVNYDTATILMSSPPKYRGDCQSCGEIYYTSCYLVGTKSKEPDND